MIEFYIVGGYLKISKKVFILEMLRKDSRLRSLLNWKSSADFSIRHPGISEPDPEDMITVNFSNTPNVAVGESPKEILGELKAKYKEKIKGKVALRGWMYTFELDLNSDNDMIEYVME